MMSVLLPASVKDKKGSGLITQTRRFRIQLRCLSCSHPHDLDLQLHDEPNDTATRDDFYASGVMDKIRFSCNLCGCEEATYDEVIYVKSPNDTELEWGA
jgi:hypothetical protein